MATPWGVFCIRPLLLPVHEGYSCENFVVPSFQFYDGRILLSQA